MAPTEKTLRDAALACFTNAQDLYAEATLLYEKGRFARAAAIAVVGLEEFAKSVVYIVAALAPDQRKWLPVKLDGHEMKHMVCEAADAAEIMNEEGWAVYRQEGYPASPDDRLADMAVVLVEWGLQSLVDSKRAKKEFKERRHRHQEEWRLHGYLQEDPTRDIYLALREPDLKNAALYVDLHENGRALHPDRITDRDARLTLAGLDYFLSVYGPLPDAVSDDARWDRLSSEVRRRTGPPQES